MLIERIRYRATLESTGGLAIRSGKPTRDGEAATIVLDVKQQPYIPATTLKGALRDAIPAGPLADQLFGKIKTADTSHAGLLSIDHGFTQMSAVSARRRTAISRKRGAADQNKLFAGQVAGATTYVVELAMSVPRNNGAADWDYAARLLGQVVAALRRGIAVGTGTRLGMGRLREDPAQADVSCLLLRDGALGWFNADGDLLNKIEQSARDHVANTPTAASWQMTLVSDGDYSSIDNEATGSNGDGEAQIKLAREGNAPLLTAATVLGALRSRAAWLAELDWLRGNKGQFVPAARQQESDTADDRFTDRDIQAVPSHLADLSSVERLFGVPGWAALLSIDELVNAMAGADFTRVNNAIDRFSGGSLHGALFHTEVASRPAWTVSLSLRAANQRPWWTPDLQAIDQTLLDWLFEDISRNGLTLGHGASKGLGWCDVTLAPATKGASNG